MVCLLHSKVVALFSSQRERERERDELVVTAVKAAAVFSRGIEESHKICISRSDRQTDRQSEATFTYLSACLARFLVEGKRENNFARV